MPTQTADPVPHTDDAADRFVMGGTCLIVDDSELLRDRLAQAIRDRGYHVETASDFDSAVAILDNLRPELAIVDLKMPGTSGMELVKFLKEKSPRTRSVVVTGYGSIANAVEAIQAGAINYVTKPVDADQILAAFHRGDANSPAPEPEDYQPPTLAEAEWEHMQQVLADTGGNISRAARLLGIERRTLQRKLKKRRPN